MCSEFSREKKERDPMKTHPGAAGVHGCFSVVGGLEAGARQVCARGRCAFLLEAPPGRPGALSPKGALNWRASRTRRPCSAWPPGRGAAP